MASRNYLSFAGYTTLNAWMVKNKDTLQGYSVEQLRAIAQEDTKLLLTAAHIYQAGKYTGLAVGKIAGKLQRKLDEKAEVIALDADIRVIAKLLLLILSPDSPNCKVLLSIIERRGAK